MEMVFSWENFNIVAQGGSRGVMVGSGVRWSRKIISRPTVSTQLGLKFLLNRTIDN